MVTVTVPESEVVCVICLSYSVLCPRQGLGIGVENFGTVVTSLQLSDGFRLTWPMIMQEI